MNNNFSFRKFFEKQDFAMLNEENRSNFPAFFSCKLFRMRRACVRNTLEDVLTETVVQQ